jgi:UDP-N-acetylglucosamine acyltransferase
MIHPQAIVDPAARLRQNVQIGAYAVIGADVEIDDGTWVGPHVVINGPTRIGRDNKIYQFCSLGEAPQHLGYRGQATWLVIGDRNTVREYCTFNRGTAEDQGKTVIGNDNFFMAYVHIAHDCVIGDHTVFANCASLAGHVTVGDHAILGGFTGVHQFCRVGAHCMTGIATITFKDIPPYVLAAGNTASPHGINVRGLKRRQYAPATIDALRAAYKIVYRSGLPLDQALARLKSSASEIAEVAHFSSFIEQSQRGIIR